MHRSVHISILDSSRKKVIVRIESDEFDPSLVIHFRNQLLDQIALNPTILEHERPFKVMRMFSTGTKWVIETETLDEGA